MVIFLRRLTIRGQPKKWGDKSERLLTKRATHPIDPYLPFATSIIQGQVTESSSHTDRIFPDSTSANPVVDGVRLERQLYFALPPFHVVRRKNLGQLVRATAYRKTLLTLSTLKRHMTFASSLAAF